MSSSSPRAEKSLHPALWTDEVWDSGLYRAREALQYGTEIFALAQIMQN